MRPEALLPLFLSTSFLENAARSEGISHLGLLSGRQMTPDNLGPLGQILGQSITLSDLLCTIEQTARLANSGERVSLRWEKDCVWLEHHCISPPDARILQTQRMDLMIYVNILRMVLGPDWYPPEVYLEGPPL